MTPRKPGCTDPRLGARLTVLAGTVGPLPRRLVDHLVGCLACQLERLDHASLDTRAVEISPELRARLSALARH